MLKGVIFDLDGTLLDSLDTLWRSFNAGVTALRFPSTPRERLMGLMSRGTGLAGILAQIYPELKPDAPVVKDIMAAIRQEYLAMCASDVRLSQGAMELFEQLRARRLKMGVVTSRTVVADKLWPEFERLHIAGFIDTAVTGAEGRRKPAPDTIITCLERLALSPAECVFVGDSQADIRAGKAAGVKTVAVATGVSSRDELAAESPDFVFDDLPGLLAKLDSVLGKEGTTMKQQEVFLFAAKAGALEGYLFRRRKPEPLANWVNNISRMYHDLSPEVKKEVNPAFAAVLKRILEYGKRALEPELREKLELMLRESSAGLETKS